MVKRMSPITTVLLALISFGIAIVAATGLILKTDTTGRIIFTVVWVLVGIGWVGQTVLAKRSGAS